MFPNDIDKVRYPLNTRRWGMLIGTLIMVAVPLCLVSPSTLPITLIPVFAAIVAGAYKRGFLGNLVPPVTHGTKVAAALLGFAAVSSIWSVRPIESVGWASSTALVALLCGVSVRAIFIEPRSSAMHIAEGLWIGFLAGLLYLGIEASTGQSIKLIVYQIIGFEKGDLKPPSHFRWRDGELVSIADVDLTRSFASVPLLLWGVLLAVLGTLSGPPGRWLASATFMFTFAVVMAGSNETAKVALLAGALAFAIGWASKTWGHRLLQTAWVIACLAIVPITLGLYRANFHNAEWLQETARHRVIIWNRFTEETMRNPVVGAGAGVAYWNPASRLPMPGEQFPRYSRDVHCVYLQIWYELGVVGAALFALLGLAILQRIQRMPDAIIPYAHGAFASAATTIASSYGLWRPWFNLMFVLAVIAFAIGLRTLLRKQHILYRCPDV